MRPSEVPRPAIGVAASQLDDELVVCTPGAVQAYVLNATAAKIWSLCDGTRDVATVAAELASMYTLDGDRALADVDVCLNELLRLGLLGCHSVAD